MSLKSSPGMSNSEVCVVTVSATLRASLSGTFLQRKDVVNQCLEFESRPGGHLMSVPQPDRVKLQWRPAVSVASEFRSCVSWAFRPNEHYVSVDVKQHWTMLRHWSQFVLNMSTDIRGHEALLHHHCQPPPGQSGSSLSAQSRWK